MTTTSVCIIEDDAPTRQLLADIVDAAPDLQLLAVFPHCQPAIAAIPGLRPHVVLVDINLPDIDGVEAVRQLKVALPASQFLMLTAYEDTEHIFAALAAGATGYLLKSTRREELLEAIAQITAGGSPMTSAIARKVVQSFARGTPPPSRPASAEVDSLSPRERSVLELLSQGYLYKEIADTMSLSLPTVSTYIRRIYEKLQVHTRTHAVSKFLGHHG